MASLILSLDAITPGREDPPPPVRNGQEAG
jgi:hypothetical protein